MSFILYNVVNWFNTIGSFELDSDKRPTGVLLNRYIFLYFFHIVGATCSSS